MTPSLPPMRTSYVEAPNLSSVPYVSVSCTRWHRRQYSQSCMGIAHDLVMHGLHFVSRWPLGRSRILFTADLAEPEGKLEERVQEFRIEIGISVSDPAPIVLLGQAEEAPLNSVRFCTRLEICIYKNLSPIIYGDNSPPPELTIKFV